MSFVVDSLAFPALTSVEVERSRRNFAHGRAVDPCPRVVIKLHTEKDGFFMLFPLLGKTLVNSFQTLQHSPDKSLPAHDTIRWA